MATRRNFSLEDGNLNGQTNLRSTRVRNYIDVDLSLEVKPSSGEVYKKYDAAAVKQAVKTLLLTNQLEKPFDPYFGANLGNMLFELIDDENSTEIERTIRNVIEVYEPRAETQDVKIKLSPDTNSVDITVMFKIINTNETIEFNVNLNRLR